MSDGRSEAGDRGKDEAPTAEGLIDTAVAPGGAVMALYHRAGRWQIRVDGRQLVDSAQSDSEKVLAVTALAAMAAVERPHVMVGGLGMGYTLRAVLSNLPAAARVTVVEALPAVVAWNEGPLGHLCGHPLRDPRVTVATADVVDAIAAADGTYDAVILDVDNGPTDLSLPDNRRLYGAAGAARLARALKPGGAAATWSAWPADAYAGELEAAGLSVATGRVPLAGGRTFHYVVLAVRPAAEGAAADAAGARAAPDPTGTDDRPGATIEEERA